MGMKNLVLEMSSKKYGDFRHKWDDGWYVQTVMFVRQIGLKLNQSNLMEFEKEDGNV